MMSIIVMKNTAMVFTKITNQIFKINMKSVKVCKGVKKSWVMISRDLGVSKLTFGFIVLTSFGS